MLAPAGRAAGAVLLALATQAAQAIEPLRLHEVAPGIHVYVGPHAEADADNQGAVGNAVLVVGDERAALVDTGGSLLFGRRLRAAVAAITDRPLAYVINTHMHPDHVFGNGAFAGDAVTFVGHHKLPRALAARGEHYLAAFGRLVGDTFAGTTVVTPTLLVDDRMRLELGARTLLLTAHPTAHTDNDLSVYDEREKVLIAGDLVFMERLPVVDGSILGWVTLMERLRSVPATRVVAGHGPPIAPWPQALEAQSRYLRKLLGGVRAAIAEGVPLATVPDRVATDEAGRWQLFEQNHPRNATAAYTELEWE